jgi:hypothetical protein
MASVKLADLTTEIVTPTEGTGIFDILLEKMETRIQEQYDAGRLNKDKAAMDAAIAEATVEKQWGYDVTTDVNGDLVLGASTGTGLIDEQVTKAQNEVDLVIGQVAKIYADVALVGQQQESELAQTSNATGGLLKAKQDLIAAQTLGFASDTKQKILKQMLEGYAVTLSIAGVATAPHATREPYIDALVFEILDDIGSTAMSNSAAVPDLGVVDP